MNLVEAAGTLFLFWAALFLVLFVAYYAVVVWIIDPIEMWWAGRKRRALAVEEHHRVLRDIDRQASRAVADISVKYQRALTEILRTTFDD